MSDTRREIEELRAETAKIDKDLVRLLDHRAKVSRKIGEARKEVPNAPFVERAAVLEVAQSSTGDMPEGSLREILGHVYAECLSLELPVPIAFVGAEGSLGHEAARARFGGSAKYVMSESAQAAISEVTHKRAQFAVVPFETRVDGPVQTTIHALMASELRVVSCFEVPETGEERVRYAIVGSRPSSRTGHDLTALVMSVADSPGALHEVLKQFAERDINLTKIQSRPAPGEAWAYLFFIEVVGHVTDRNLVAALEDVKRLAKFYRVLGSYQAP